MLQVWIRRWAGECVNDGGGGWRSIKTRLWDGLREERSVAVARPMPEEPPVMMMVFGVDFKVWRADALGWKRAIFLGCFVITISGIVNSVFD